MEDAMPTHGRTFPGDPQELRSARRWTRATLNGHPRSEDAELIVTELGTNAVTHTASGKDAGSFHVRLTVSEQTIRIAVADGGQTETAPEVQHPPLNATHGRGLSLVVALADNVTVQGDDSGRTVTAELRVHASLRESAPCP
ncbi:MULTISPECIES: ATP-binding protein [unclassified Streptomyces]|uniref:ATP-binding protein n=1 Tax=unclassified Streptomyces TaxID=2593676 RepID=UPI0036FAABC5